MILTCENCQTRYLLPSHSLAPDGRRVRCTVCNHEWDQDYDGDDYVEESDDEDLEPIPESVRPIPEGSAVPSLEIREGKKGLPVAGMLASAAVFAGVLGLLLFLKTPITNAWPQSGAFYAMLGMEQPLPGEGLIFDQLKGTSDDAETGGLMIDLSGNIVNLSAERISVPIVRFALNNEGGEIGEVWYLKPEQEFLDAHGDMAFHTVYQSESEDAKGVNVSFSLLRDIPAAEDEVESEDEGEDESDDDHSEDEAEEDHGATEDHEDEAAPAAHH